MHHNSTALYNIGNKAGRTVVCHILFIQVSQHVRLGVVFLNEESGVVVYVFGHFGFLLKWLTLSFAGGSTATVRGVKQMTILCHLLGLGNTLVRIKSVMSRYGGFLR